MKGWTPQAVEQASKPVSAPATRPAAPAQGKAPPTDKEGRTEDVTPPAKPVTEHYAHPYQLNVANGTHYPGRMRAVLVGPVNEKLLTRMVALMNEFKTKPQL